jgi:hypothetical protein
MGNSCNCDSSTNQQDETMTTLAANSKNVPPLLSNHQRTIEDDEAEQYDLKMSEVGIL